MKKIALALAGASVALAGLASPAAAADWNGHDRGRIEQVQSRSFFGNGFAQPNRGFVRNGMANNNRSFVQGRSMNDRMQVRQWQRGDRFDARYASHYRVIEDPSYYDLQPAPYGYRWVQSGDSAVLVAVASGLIGALVANAF